MSSSIEVKRLSRTISSNDKIVDNLDFRIPGNTFLVIVGDSGVGKTTLLRMLAGLLPCDKGGEILFDSVDLTRHRPQERPVRMMFQEGVLYDHLTVEQNARLALKHANPLGGTSTDTFINDLAERFAINHLLDSKPRNMSGGEKQRASLLRAYAGARDVILLDEPIKAALEPKRRMEIASQIRSLHDEWGLTTVYVTHDHEEAAFLADKLLVMSKEGASLYDPDVLLRAPKFLSHGRLYGGGAHFKIIGQDGNRVLKTRLFDIQLDEKVNLLDDGLFPILLLCRPKSLSAIEGDDFELVRHASAPTGTFITAKVRNSASGTQFSFLTAQTPQNLPGTFALEVKTSETVKFHGDAPNRNIEVGN